VIVVQEGWGLNGQIRDVARRLAREGYAAIVPDLYHGQVAETAEAAHELSRALDEEQALADLAAAAAWLRASPRVGTRPIGVLGFCLGGGIALQFALHSPEPAAVVMFYGAPETDPAKLASLRAPLLGHFGAEDRGIPTSRVDAFREALAKAGRNADLRTYAGAGHAFMHEGLPSYHLDAARQAWARTLAFLQKTLRS
jgi:carboxymethylenebutenolidase